MMSIRLFTASHRLLCRLHGAGLSLQADILEMKKSQFMEDGIMIRQSKTSVAQIKAWSPRLESAIQQAASLPLKKGMSSIYVIHQENGSRYTRDGFNSRWIKAKQEAAAKFPHLDFNFTFHDLKAKGISDLSGSLYEKQAIQAIKMLSRQPDTTEKSALLR